MDNATKKFVEEQIEKLAGMVAKGFEHTATKDDIARLEGDIGRVEGEIIRLEGEIVRLEGKIDSGFDKRLAEQDQLRDRMRVLETRVDRIEASH